MNMSNFRPQKRALLSVLYPSSIMLLQHDLFVFAHDLQSVNVPIQHLKSNNATCASRDRGV